MTKKIQALSLLLLLILPAAAQTDSVYFYFNRSKEALQEKDTNVFYHAISKAHNFHPYHPTIIYYHAMASALKGQQQEALDFLKKAIHLKADFDLTRPEFNLLQTGSQFEGLKTLQKQLLEPVIHSDTAFVIKDRTLHIESIANGETPGVFYCGSIHKRKIIRVDASGNFTDFIPAGHEGLTSVFGVKVDRKRNVLWACASPLPEMENYDSLARSAIFKYDLKTRQLLARHEISGDNGSVLGDLVLDNAGNAFVSDSRNNIIYKVDIKTNKLEEFFRSDAFWNLQGITFTPDGKTLFIADYMTGLYKVDMVTKEMTRLTETFDFSTKSIDGLTFYNNSLISIQNYIYPMRVTQYFLNKLQDSLVGYKVLDRAHPAFNEPTIGCLQGDSFYYVANSLWSGYENGKLKPVDQLQDVVILKVDLKKVK